MDGARPVRRVVGQAHGRNGRSRSPLQRCGRVRWLRARAIRNAACRPRRRG